MSQGTIVTRRESEQENVPADVVTLIPVWRFLLALDKGDDEAVNAS